VRSILALDVSKSNTGWAFGLPGDKPTSGVERFGVAGSTDDDTWRAAMVWLSRHMDALQPGIVAIEAAIMSSAPGQGGFTNPQSQAVLWGLQAVMRTVVKAKMPGRAQLVNVSSARKIFTGKGQYHKGEAKPAVQARCLELGWLDAASMSPDRADALCVFAFVAAQESPDFALSLNFNKSTRRAAAKPLASVGF
jgi:hypothetical protein